MHWNIQQVTVTGQMTEESHQEWQYSEKIIKWILPQKYDNINAVKKYLTSIQTEILNWAEATELNIQSNIQSAIETEGVTVRMTGRMVLVVKGVLLRLRQMAKWI